MKKYIILIASVVFFAVTSCKKEYELISIDFTGNLEQPESDNSAAKNYLAMEQYIYWDNGDEIQLFSGDEPVYSDQAMCRTVAVTPTEKLRYASFHAEGFAAADHYWAIYPASAYVEGTYKSINFPSVYTYRNDAHADFSFPKPGIPMYAYCNDADHPTMDFHSLVGFARIQLTSTETKTITSLSFSSSVPISGVFDINDISNPTNEPTVKPSASATTNITISGINKEVGPDKLLTFYLPLPAQSVSGNYKTYPLTMKVTTEDSKEANVSFEVKIRRNCIAPMPSLTLGTQAGVWKPIGQGISGCGTQERPFLIFDAKDLKLVRDAFNTSNHLLNGKDVTTENCYFTFRSSKLNLTSSGDNAWTSGIQNFRGTFTNTIANAQNHSITNTSGVPIFESIGTDGKVVDVLVGGNITSTNLSDFSPLCGTNSGTIEDCQNVATIAVSNANVAGLCVTNQGTIKNSSNAATIRSDNGHSSSICLENQGTIIGCNTQSLAKLNGSQVAGVCHTNASTGTIQNCQVVVSLLEANYNAPFGGIAYTNNGLIDHCEFRGSVISTGWVGGICVENTKTVNACRIGCDNLRGVGFIGGIVAHMNTSTAEVRNCYNSSNTTSNVGATVSTGENYVGGIVGALESGTIKNCYCSLEVQSFNAIYGSIVGEATYGTVYNCYNGSRTSNFYGRVAGQSNIGENCFDPQNISYTTWYDINTGYLMNSSANPPVPDEDNQMWKLLYDFADGTTYYKWGGPVVAPVLIDPTITGSKRSRRR